MTARQTANAEVVDTLDALDSGLDPTRVASMSREVVGAVQMIRDMLKARSEVLESCRSTLIEQQNQLAEQRARFEQDRMALCDEYDAREAEVSERERRYEGMEERVQQLTVAFESEASSITERYEEIRRQALATEEKAHELDARERILDDLEKEFREQKAQFETRIATLDADREKLRVAGKQLGEAKARFLKEHDEWQVARDEHASVVEQFEEDRQALAASEQAFEEHVRALDDQRQALVRRESLITEKEGTLELRLNQAEKQKEELLSLRRRWEEKMAELSDASTSLASLQEQLAVEMGHITTDRSELLDRFGLSDKGWSNGQVPDGGLPRAIEQPAPAAVERYQKLCRDARRRAIGAV
ncbi:MAG: hypothetical protein HY899_02810 [Deltaproteobacteria bacterium]|nr:hypothetical protein [Deltaproteobacteria bacterium]